jgi:hypothetical protein
VQRMIAIAAVALLAVLAATLTVRAALNMKPGLWETTTYIDGHKINAEKKCYLQKDIDALEKMMRGDPAAQKGPCSDSNFKQSGNTITYTMTCSFSKGKTTTSTVSGTYNGDTTTGTVVGSGTTSKIDSKRVGDCFKSSFDK